MNNENIDLFTLISSTIILFAIIATLLFKV